MIRDIGLQGAMSARPQQNGIVTLLFSEMINSTALKQHSGDRAAAELFRIPQIELGLNIYYSPA